MKCMIVGLVRVLAWNKSELFRRWPKCMVPGGQKIEGNNILFTVMLENTREKYFLLLSRAY